jgi:hypothetical protein
VDRGSIRLAWQERSPEKDDPDKIPNSRFHIIADDKFRYDIAIGEGCNDPDPKEEEPLGSDDGDEAAPGDEGDGTSSFVEGRMAVEARRSRPGICPIWRALTG